MGSKKFRVGVSGVSGIAQMLHLPILSKMANVEVSAVFDYDYYRAKRIAEKFKIKHVFNNFDDFVRSPNFDLLDICSPVNLHFSEASSAIKSGKHALIEKPFTQNAIEAAAIVELAQSKQKRIMSLMNLKFRPDAIALKSLLDSNKIGDVFFVKAGWLRRNEKWQQKAVFQKNQQGVIMHLGLQLVDLSLWLLNDPNVRTVKANGFRQIMKSWVEDTAFLHLGLENNVSVALEVGWKLDYGADFLYVNLLGEHGAAKLNPFTLLTENNGKLVETRSGETIFHDDPFHKSYENALSHFFYCLENDQPLQISGAEIINRMKIIDAVYESVKTGKEVELT
ncbi:MAG: Gfo/Idh/MocA family oxidoreductase [Calditrichaeota bacterium]|nr:Gfo/Idh/MocA family oxidoreductase [Calditrichota bacterium]